MRLHHRSPVFASAVMMLAGSLTTPTTQAADAQQTGWAAWFNSYRFNDQLGLVSDIQLRKLPIDGGSDRVSGPFVALQNEAFVNTNFRR